MRTILSLGSFVLWCLVGTVSAGELVGEPLAPGGAARVALQGDTALVANVGTSYVYREVGERWIEEGVLVHGGLAAGRALCGDTVFLGVPSNDDLATDAGAVFVFTRNAGTWTLEQQLFASDGAMGDAFGVSVAVDGDVAVVGATGHGLGGTAYRFERVGGVWSEVNELALPSSLVAGQGFGSSMALQDGTLLIDSLRGGAYAFADTGGVFEQEAELPGPPMPIPGFPYLGEVALDGGTAVVCAHTLGASIYVRSGTEWALEATLEPGPNLLARSCAVSGDVVVLGNSVGPSTVHMLETAVFVRSQGTWSRLANTLGPHSAEVSVALDGDRVLAGVHGSTNSVTLYHLPDHVAPSVVHRNAGTNPDSFRARPAYVGESLALSVDLATTGHAMALVLGFDSPFGLTLGGGQTLLCFDLLGSGGELINTGFHPGPIAEIELPVPNDLAFAEFSVCTQAVHAFGVAPFALSNAQDIVIGACF